MFDQRFKNQQSFLMIYEVISIYVFFEQITSAHRHGRDFDPVYFQREIDNI